MESKKQSIKAKQPNKQPLFMKIILGGLLLLVAIACIGAALVYFISPVVIRQPKQEHYHFRMRILVDGKAENFAEQKYQTGYSKDLCNANLTEQPIHFHDNKDQFTHIHWEGMTGGMVLKYYGWNFIGGLPNMLGYKLDNLRDIQPVTTHGNYLPAIPKDDNFYIYVGDENSYRQVSFNDWVNKDLEEVFGKESNFPAHDKNKQSSLLDKVIPKANAHGSADDADGDDGNTPVETPEEKLTRINNLIGNVVIFVQKDPPSEQQIKEQFQKLEPLSESTCGG